jgi:hypothetical protein
VANIFGNYLNGVDRRFKILISGECLPLFGFFGYVKNDKVCNDRNYYIMHVIFRCIALLLSLSSLQRVRIETCLWRYLHGSRTRQWIFLSNMDGGVIFGFTPISLEVSTVSMRITYIAPFIFLFVCT